MSERKRRTPEQIIADLEAKIASVKQRAAAKEAAREVKSTPEGRALLAAAKALVKATEVAQHSKDEGLVSALEAAQAALAPALVAAGLRMPNPRGGRRGGRRKKGGEAA
jgi:hypothetical protein